MRRALTFGAVCTALLILAAPVDAQQWRFTPFAGGAVIFGGEPDDAQNLAAPEGSVEFENGFALGGTIMRRWGHWGVEIGGQWTPTRTTSVVAFLDSELDPGGLGTGGDPFREDPLTIAFSNSQNLFQAGASLVWFTTEGWGEGEAVPAREFYGLAGIGLASLTSDHPARENLQGEQREVLVGNRLVPLPLELEGWEAGAIELMLNFGAGVQFNLTSGLAIQFEVRDALFQATNRAKSIDAFVKNGGAETDPEKTWQHAFSFRQGVTIIAF